MKQGGFNDIHATMLQMAGKNGGRAGAGLRHHTTARATSDLEKGQKKWCLLPTAGTGVTG